MVVGVGNLSVSRILRTFQDSGTSSPKRNGKCGLKQNTPRTDKIMIRNSKISVEMSPSTIGKRLLEVSGKATRPSKNDETHLFVQRTKLGVGSRSEDETLLPDHTQQTVKYTSKPMFWGFFTTNGTRSLVPLKAMRVNFVEQI
ncbi:hypothetical protein TNCV_86081 [Trichonephila clavipes]|nr:hypothetical protein TNCV_86081 [Trichonephila clavipes]